MPQDRPTAKELLDAVREFLEGDLLPALEGRRAFHTRVSVNILKILERELAQGPAFEAAELSRLKALLGKDGSLADLNAELSKEIRSGKLDGQRAKVLDHVRQSVREKLQIANPKYLEE